MARRRRRPPPPPPPPATPAPTPAPPAPPKAPETPPTTPGTTKTTTAACLIAALAAYHFAWAVLDNRLAFSRRSPLQFESALYSESGFYYSFYKDVATAPSWARAWRAVAATDACEYPQTINALARFNVGQEVLLGALYRLTGGAGAPDPALFYLRAVLALFALGVASLGLLAARVGRGPWGALAALAFYAAHWFECARVWQHPPLRENFAIPLLFAALAFPRRWLLLPLLMLLAWQFSHFVLATHAAALAALVALRLVPVPVARRRAARWVAVFAAAALLQDSMAAASTSLFLHAALGLLAGLHLVDALGLRRPLARLAAIAAAVAAVHLAVRLAAGPPDDATHIYDVLRVRLGGGESADLTTRLYTSQAAFSPLEASWYATLASSGLLPAAALGAAAALASRDPAAVNVAALCAAFCAMAALMMRFVALAVPMLCVLAAVLTRRLPRPLLAALLAALVWFRAAPAVRTALDTVTVGEVSDHGMPEMLAWARDWTPPEAVFSADMVAASAIKLAAGRRVTSHPQFETLHVRERTRRIYQIFGRRSPEYVHRMLRDELHTDYVAVHFKRCFGTLSRVGFSWASMVNDEIVAENGGSEDGLPEAFCRTVQRDLHGGGSPLFELVFHNAEYDVLRVLPGDGSERARPYAELARETDPRADMHACHLASRLPGRQAAPLMGEFPESAYCTWELGELAERAGRLDLAEEMYRTSVDLDPRDAVHATNLAIFLDEAGTDVARAEELYRAAVAQEPTNAVFRGNLGYFLYLQRRLREALDEYERAEALGGADAQTYCTYALVARHALRDERRAGELMQMAREAPGAGGNGCLRQWG